MTMTTHFLWSFWPMIILLVLLFFVFLSFRCMSTSGEGRMTGPWLVLYILYLLPVHGEPVVIKL